MGAFSDKLIQWWQHSDRSQKVVTLGGIGVLVCLLVATFMFAMRPRYETLFANLTEQSSRPW